MFMNRWEWLISNDKLEIYEFSVDRHESYIVENRYFPFYVMSYIQEGGASTILDGKLYDTPVGHLVLIPAYTRHSHFIPEGQGPTTFLWWYFNITVGGLDLMKLIRFPISLKSRTRQRLSPCARFVWRFWAWAAWHDQRQR